MSTVSSKSGAATAERWRLYSSTPGFVQWHPRSQQLGIFSTLHRAFELARGKSTLVHFSAQRGSTGLTARLALYADADWIPTRVQGCNLKSPEFVQKSGPRSCHPDWSAKSIWLQVRARSRCAAVLVPYSFSGISAHMACTCGRGSNS
jgi:hypothetical protein